MKIEDIKIGQDVWIIDLINAELPQKGIVLAFVQKGAKRISVRIDINGKVFEHSPVVLFSTLEDALNQIEKEQEQFLFANNMYIESYQALIKKLKKERTRIKNFLSKCEQMKKEANK